MKHVFIINPTAGKKDCTAALMAMSKALAARHGLEAECILTKRPGHAAETARTLAQSGRAVRIYACGGDGTVNEVANGIAGSETAAMTCIPVGTGNDFLRNFGDAAPLFADAEHLWDGTDFFLDAIDCNGRLALTVACSGFDAQVAEDVHTYGSLPLLGGQGPGPRLDHYPGRPAHAGGVCPGRRMQWPVLRRGLHARGGGPDG